MKTWNDEAELIARCKRELPYNHSSFEKLVLRYKDLVFTLCYRLVGRRSDAEDLMQEVLTKVFLNLKDFEERSKFSSWLYRIAHNHCLNFINRRTRETEVIAQFAEEQKREELQAGGKQLSLRLEETLGHISPSARSVLVMKYVMGLDLKEIADALETSVSAVKMRLMRARGEFREIYKGIK